jgi:hypothetical protein
MQGYKNILIGLTLTFLLIQCMSKKIKSKTIMNIQNTHSNGCFEIIPKGGQNFRIRSTKTTDANAAKRLDLYVKLKSTCEVPKSTKITVNDWKLNGDLLSGAVVGSIMGTECITISDVAFNGSKLTATLTPSTSTECENLKDIEFIVQFSTEYTEPLECSTAGEITFEELPQFGYMSINVDLTPMNNLCIPESFILNFTGPTTQTYIFFDNSTSVPTLVGLDTPFITGTYTLDITDWPKLCGSNTWDIFVVTPTFTLPPGDLNTPYTVYVQAQIIDSP